MSERPPGGEQRWLDPERSKVLSNREFLGVYANLSVPETYFRPGQHVLSVGEGLSNFARKVRDEFGASVTAIDPIYSLGKEILTLDKEIIKQRLDEYYGDGVRYIDFRPKLADWPAEEQVPDPSQLVAGSVYELPFKNKSFDTIVSNRLMEHINFAQAIPELMRVIKSEGEIRFGDCLISAVPRQQLLLPGRAERTEEGGDKIMIHPSPGFYEGMHWLAENTEASVYFQLTGQNRYAHIDERFKLFYTAGLMIIRLDQMEPVTLPYSRKSLEHLERSGAFDHLHYQDFPHIGEVYQVDFKGKDENDQMPAFPLVKLDRPSIVDEE